VTDSKLDQHDRRLIAALQCDPRVAFERLSSVLDLDPRAVRRRLRALLDTATVSIAVTVPRSALEAVMMVRIRVLRGKVDLVTSALAVRPDIPFIDVSAGGDEISAILVADPTVRDRFVFRQLPATSAVVSVDAQTVMHVYADSSDWRLDVLTAEERSALTPDRGSVSPAADLDPLDREILSALRAQPRASVAALASAVAKPESTVRRRLADLQATGRFAMQAFVDPRDLGLAVDAGLWMKVRPSRLDEAGRALARHPAVHGALATTGSFNLHAAVWLRDLQHLYEFVTSTLGGLDIESVDTVLVGKAVKRPGRTPQFGT
jgi:DNA-binding Lrp family transcriptional regulator